VRRARRLDMLEADESADAVIDMDDEIARRQSGNLGQKIFRALAAPALRREAVAQDILLADDGEIAGTKPASSPITARATRESRSPALRERRHGLDFLQAMFGQHRAQALARAVGPAGDDDLLALFLQGADVIDRSLEHICVFVIALGEKLRPDRRRNPRSWPPFRALRTA